MAHKRYGLTEARIKRFIREGRGSGRGKYYKPWWTVANVPSKGRSHRPYCTKTGREHQLLTDGEYFAFLVFWWAQNAVDIREQFPLLDRLETLAIAAELGIRHPEDRRSGALWVISTDFLVTYLTTRGEITLAIDDEIRYMKIANKLDIEKLYWKRRGVKFIILTEKQLKTSFTRNLSWILDSRDTCGYFCDDQALLCDFADAKLQNPYAPILSVCKLIDRKKSFKPGTALACLRHLLGVKRIMVDLHAEHLLELPIGQFSIAGA